MNLVLRPMRADDGEALKRIHERAVLERAAAAITPEIAASWIAGLTPDGYAGAAAKGEHFELAEIDGRIAGFCSHMQNEIVGLYVDPDFAEGGLGRTLLAGAEKRIRGKGYGEIVLTSSLHAVGFYERCGYRLIERAVRATRGGVPMPVVDMLKPMEAPACDPSKFHNMSYANFPEAEGAPDPVASAQLPPLPSRDIADLLTLMAALRTPVTGCPWDLEQTFATIAPYTIEEAYEVADAIARGDMVDLREELGDLLLQVVYHARLAEEARRFAFADVVEAITGKLIRRHPHVFGDEAARTAGMAKGAWERIKAEEKAERARLGGQVKSQSVLSGVPLDLPALTRAVKLQDKAARVGFDWKDPQKVLDKVVEETGELRTALGSGDRAEAAQELGDLLFVLANLARHLEIDPEAALRGTIDKFLRRFGHIERELAAQGRSPAQASLAEMDALWTAAKAIERNI